MSRHRNVKHLVDDYYDEEDDYYDDNYDDYDDTYVAPKPKATKVKNAPPKQPPAKQSPAPKPQTPMKKQQQPVSTQPKSESNNTHVPKSASTASTTVIPPSNAATPALSPPVPDILVREQGESNKTPLTVVILGHVDAGKSSVTGHLLYHHPQQTSTTKRSGKAPPQYAWLLDEDEEERAHGVTMDIATKSLRTASGRLLVLQDAPGHADYVPAAITGTALADAALLTVDVTDFQTAFQAGQLREHALLARGLGVSSILIVLNKMDLVNWEQNIFEDVQQQLVEFLVSPQCGFSAAKVRCVPVSAVNGDNIYKPRTGTWYTGPTLWEALDQFDSTPQYRKLLEKPFRLLISDVVSSTGSGVSVRAKVLQGWVQSNESVIVWPNGDETKLTKLQRFDADMGDKERSQYASAGEIIDVVLTGIDAMRISPGQVLTRPNQRPPLAKKCQATIILLCQQANTVIIRGAQVTFHMHSLDIPCNISKLHRALKPDGSTLYENPRALSVHGSLNVTALVELTLQVPICMQAFADCRPLGRFVLRRAGDTIAVGRIENVLEG